MGLWALVFLSGILLRAAACRWNAEVMHGDVSLFAIAARELAETGALVFPHRTNFLGFVPYMALSEPASLHNPLFAALAGSLADWTQLHVYFVLRGLTWASGCVLLALVIRNAVGRAASHGGILCALGIGFSPLLIDFSGNGSPYILLALWLWVACAWLGSHPPQGAGSLALFGVLSGLATELHTSQVFLPLMLVILMLCGHLRVARRGLAIFLAAYLLTRLPAQLWRWEHGIETFNSGAGGAFLFRRGLLEPFVSSEGHVQFLRHPLTEFPLFPYLKHVLVQGGWFLRDLVRELGPFAIAMMLVGARAALARRKRWLSVLPALGYLLIIALWAHHDHRFLVPLLPLAWWLAGKGFDHLRASDNGPVRGLGLACSVGALAWPAVRLLQPPRSQYYGRYEAQYQQEYFDLQALATQLTREAPGLVLGWGRGEETVWTHRLPYIGANWAERPVFEAFVRDFDPRYVLTTTERIGDVQELQPSARVLMQRHRFVLLSL